MLGEHRLLTGTAGVCSWLKNSKKKELNKYIPIPGFEPGSTVPRRARWKRVRPGCVPNYTSLDFSFWTRVHISSKYYIQKHAGFVLKCPRSVYRDVEEVNFGCWSKGRIRTEAFGRDWRRRFLRKVWRAGWLAFEARGGAVWAESSDSQRREFLCSPQSETSSHPPKKSALADEKETGHPSSVRTSGVAMGIWAIGYGTPYASDIIALSHDIEGGWQPVIDMLTINSLND